MYPTSLIQAMTTLPRILAGGITTGAFLLYFAHGRCPSVNFPTDMFSCPHPVAWMKIPSCLLVLCLLSACDSSTTTADEPDPVVGPMTAELPARSQDALSGSAFLDETATASADHRQGRAVSELLTGNLPDAIRILHPIPWVTPAGDSLTIHVLSDYLAIGSDDSFVYMPLTLPSARTVARAWGMLFPVPTMVDAIYGSAELRLDPQPMTPGPLMSSNGYYREHTALIADQRAGRAPGGLIAGHKKDIVGTVRLDNQPGRIAIYGWHRGVDDPIQPLSLVHHDRYEDYSHGLRLIHPVAWRGTEPVDLSTVLPDLERWSWGSEP